MIVEFLIALGLAVALAGTVVLFATLVIGRKDND